MIGVSRFDFEINLQSFSELFGILLVYCFVSFVIFKNGLLILEKIFNYSGVQFCWSM